MNILVNNAGIVTGKSFIDSADHMIELTMKVCLCVCSCLSACSKHYRLFVQLEDGRCLCMLGA